MWKSLCLLFVLVCATAAFPVPDVKSTANDDLVTSLPGLSPNPPFAHYSGYLPVGSKQMHYWFAESQGSPTNDPLVLWLNGGPGCSSMEGMLYENGPFRIQEDGKTVILNNYSWNKLANMLYLESPAGVGFSWSPNKDDYNNDDDGTAEDNYQALQQFFIKFPEFVGRRFFVTGESYGGIYVPMLAARILKGNSNGEGVKINLEGIAVGNGISSFEINDNSVMYFAYYHGLLGNDLWSRLQSHCCVNGVCNFHDPSTLSCQNDIQEAQFDIYNTGVNYYGMYNKCLSTPPAAMQRTLSLLFQKIPKRSDHKLSLTPPCVDATGADIWLNSADVRGALHIAPQALTWTICSDILNYNRTVDSIIPVYPALLSSIRALIYNGDTDLACNFFGDQQFVDGLQRPVKVKRSAWNVDGQVAGFVKEYDQIAFTTVLGAGHMVPQDRPAPAYHLFDCFLNHKPL